MRGTSSGAKLGFFSATAGGLLLVVDRVAAALLDVPDPVGRSLGNLLFAEEARFDAWLSELGPESSCCERRRVDGRGLIHTHGLAPERVSLRVRNSTEHLPVWADVSELEMVLTNLVVNAVDAMPAGGELRVLSRRERVPVRGGDEGGDYAVLEVCDTGEGISPEVLPM